ncbi:MAG: HlyD family efflux transporter periplasmic adaptor subunit [Muribaculaceae bacterium]|nr:HlyD family efflux transporter periplasmic adaptor subunit [Muribaculaceae bacterium]
MKNILYTAAFSLFITGCNSAPDFDATGIFEATTVTISAETSGKLLSVNINDGDTVMNGANIAVVDTSILVLQQKQLATQRLATESTSPDVAAQAAALRARIANQQRECDRYSRLLADGATTQKIYDDAVSQLTVLKSELTALLSTLGKNRSSISDNAVAIQYQTDQIEDQINKSIINSPLTGTVLEKYAEPGEFATPGRSICKIADLNKIYLRAYFTVGQLANIKLGQKVTVIADFGGDEQFEYPGTITWIAQESEFTPKSIQTRDSRSNLVYATKIAVNNDGRLKLGQYGEVRL